MSEAYISGPLMKAIIWTKYGPPDVLELREIEKPTPKDNEVLIRIHATTVTAGDCEQRRMQTAMRYRIPMRMYVGFKRPKRITILGMELAGEIESVGKDVERFKEGEQVFAATGFVGMGACAEYICLPEEPEGGALSTKPSTMTYVEASAVPMGGLEALCFLKQGDIRNRQKVLINGAGGTVGPFAVQLAKYFGAEVTGVDSTEKLEMLRSIGADRVIDYTREDFTKSGETYDLILDVVGRSSFSGSIRSLEQNGCYLIANPRLMVRWRSAFRTGGKKVMFGAAHPRTEDLVFLKQLIEEGKLRSVIGRRYPLEQAAEAHRYVETGHKTGQVVIKVQQRSKRAGVSS
jgi:NADPH:quinone reductase-like Zn-dependent oxidoreductase